MLNAVLKGGEIHFNKKYVILQFQFLKFSLVQKWYFADDYLSR